MAKFLTATVTNGLITQADILLSESEIKNNPYADKEKNAVFFQYISKLIQTANKTLSDTEDNTPKPTIKCTKINVAENIQQSWYNYANDNGIDKNALTMSLAFCGPKALSEIPNNQVQILEGCLSY